MPKKSREETAINGHVNETQNQLRTSVSKRDGGIRSWPKWQYFH